MPSFLEEIELEELSLVDRGGNQYSHAVLMKRASVVDQLIETITKSYDEPKETFAEALADQLRMERTYEVENKMYPLFRALQESVQTIMSGEDIDKESKVRAETENFITAALKEVMGKSNDTLEDSGSPGESNPSAEGGQMDPEQLEKSLGDSEKVIAQLTKALDDAGHTVEINGADVKVTKAEEPEYIDIDGEKVLKSAIPAPLLKQLEAQAERVAKLEEKDERESLAKRAEEAYPNLAGSPVQKGQLVKAVDSISDEETRGAVEDALKAADAAVGKLFDMVGDPEGGDDTETAHDKLTKMAEAAVEEGKYDSVSKAYAAIAASPEGREIRAAER